MFPNLDGLPVELLFEILNDFTLHERAKVSQVGDGVPLCPNGLFHFTYLNMAGL